jgi:hypothetical protein
MPFISAAVKAVLLVPLPAPETVRGYIIVLSDTLQNTTTVFTRNIYHSTVPSSLVSHSRKR